MKISSRMVFAIISAIVSCLALACFSETKDIEYAVYGVILFVGFFSIVIMDMLDEIKDKLEVAKNEHENDD